MLKTLAALNVKERRARQEGYFAAKYQEKSHELGVVSQGTKTGERTIAQFLQYKVDFRAFEELGMRDKHQERMKELLATEKGMLLFCSLPAGGLTTTVTVALRNSDRYMRDFVGVLEKSSKEPHVENVEYTTFDPSKGESPQGRLPALIRKQPNVLVIYDLPNAETVNILCEAACDDKLIITVIRAKEAVEALMRVLLLKVPAEQFAPAITAVVNQRLIRKLCETCKQAYTPTPELMKKLGIPPGRIESFYRPPENPEEVCPACDGIGYFGRTSVFELLTVDDEIREALVKQPKLEILRKLARKAGNRTLQEEGLVLVARGDTSLAELKRALDQ